MKPTKLNLVLSNTLSILILDVHFCFLKGRISAEALGPPSSERTYK